MTDQYLIEAGVDDYLLEDICCRQMVLLYV